MKKLPEWIRFNEAVGYYRRNRRFRREQGKDKMPASMRPSGITDGILVREGDVSASTGSLKLQ